MKKYSITLLLLLTTWSLFADTPLIKNYHRDTYRAGTQTWAIAQAPGGGMYFANNDGVLSFNGEQWQLTRLNNRTSARSLYYDKEEGLLYVGGTNELGTIEITQSGPVYRSLLDTLGIYLNEIWAIGRNSEGNLWFEDNSTRYTFTPDSLTREDISRYQAQGQVFCTAENDQYYAEGTISDGIRLRRKSDGSSVHLTTGNGLQNNSVLCLYFDRNGGLWAGLDQGIDYVMLDYPVYNLFGNNDDFGGGYAICRCGDWLYLGTNLGLYRVRESAMGLSLKDSDIERVHRVDGQVWSLECVGDEVIACCGKGVFVCRGTRVSNFIPTDGAWKVEPLQGHPDILLGSSYTRFFTLEKKHGRWGFGSWLSGFDEAGKAFEQDSDGRIWFSHHVKGLYRLTLSEDCRSVTLVEKMGNAQGFPTDRTNYPAEYHGAIVFTTEGGFFSFDNTTGRAVPVNDINYRFAGTPNSLSVFETPLGNMRYYSSGAMQAVEYRSDNGSVMDSLSLRSLINHRPLGFECITSLDERNLLLNSDDGFMVLDLDRLIRSSSNTADTVFISSVRAAESGETLYYGSAPVKAKQTLRIHHKQNSLEFAFISPVFDSYSQTEYSTMLKGYDRQFSAFDPASSRRYSRIPSGHYTFLVKARNPLHGNRETEDSIDITILRPWSGSVVAWIIYIIGAGLLVLVGIRVFNAKAERKAHKLAEAEAEKMRQAQVRKNLHEKADDLAASTMNLQRKNELLQRISVDIDKTIESEKRGEPSEVRLKRLRALSELVRENIVHDNDWQKFQHNFDLVYDDFLKRLGEKYPSLSLSDKRICAYIRMDLGSKDIAPLLGMTVRSVEMTRYRIRQKIGLTREDNLTAFLQKF